MVAAAIHVAMELNHSAEAITPQATIIRQRHGSPEEEASAVLFNEDNHKAMSTKNPCWKANCRYPIRILLALLLYIVVTVAIIPQPVAHLTLKDAYTGTEKTTLVLMGYSPKRLSNYEAIFAAYGAMDQVVDQVLFLWNNLEHAPPKVPTDTDVPIVVLPQKENSMNNRFGRDVTEHTKTECVTLVDDDVLLSQGIIRSMIDEWIATYPSNVAERPVVGIQGDGRIAFTSMGGYAFPCWHIEGWLLQKNCWLSTFGLSSASNNIKKNNLNVVVGKTMTFATSHLYKYQVDKHLWNYTESHFCEDILMNALIRNVTHYSDPVLVPKQRFSLGAGQNAQWRKRLNDGDGLSFNGIAGALQWKDKRSECVYWAAQHFGDNIWSSPA